MGRSISMLRNKKGFTLIELIVVLAVLAIIMAIAVPRFMGVQETAKVDSDMATLASIAKLAEFEFVRLNMIPETDEGFSVTGTVEGLIKANFAEEKIFQSNDLNELKAEDVEVTFSNGKVNSIDVGTYEFVYSEGKFTLVEES